MTITLKKSTAFIPVSTHIKQFVNDFGDIIGGMENIDIAHSLSICTVQRYLQYSGTIADALAKPLHVYYESKSYLQLSQFGCIGVIYVDFCATEVYPEQKYGKYLGYFVVKLNSGIENIYDSTEAEILGFTRDFDQTLSLDDLEVCLDGFFDWEAEFASNLAVTA
jgi:hypothetical protein